MSLENLKNHNLCLTQVPNLNISGLEPRTSEKVSFCVTINDIINDIKSCTYYKEYFRNEITKKSCYILIIVER